MVRRCELLEVNRSGCYLKKPLEMDLKAKFNLLIMDLIDREYTEHPFYGSRRMTAILCGMGYAVNRKRVVRLMRLMGLEAIYPKPNLSKGNKEHKKYPYLLADLEIAFPDHVWSTDITYIKLHAGYAYCTVVIDWHSRYVIAWRVSNTLDGYFCQEVLEEALQTGRPRIFNTDQGVQYTCRAFTGILEKASIQISMDGKGRALDNIFVERLWRSLKYEDIYIKDYQSVSDARDGIGRYFRFYNERRPHQSLGYRCPRDVYMQGRA